LLYRAVIVPFNENTAHVGWALHIRNSECETEMEVAIILLT